MVCLNRSVCTEQRVNQGEMRTSIMGSKSSVKCCFDQKQCNLGFEQGDMAKFCHWNRCATTTLMDKVFLLWLCLRNPGYGFASKLNTQLCFMRHSVGPSRQLVNCHEDYTANTAHLLTTDNKSWREHFCKIP